jgi:small subunit ribosomal protein S27e
MAKKIHKTRSRFLRVKCNDCGNEQILFDKAASKVKCLACDKILAEPKGGKADVKTEVVSVVDRDL